MFRRSPLVVAVAAASVVSVPAQAAQSTATSIVEEVVVVASPIRDSQAAAILAKRDANNVVDIISSDTIGRMPDQNLADSLGRLPGLAIERDQGQARFINFRGAPFRWTAIAFDGIDVLGAENGRVPRFDSFPSVITSSVSANKAITPDIPGEAVAGFVNIQTFDPFSIEGPALSVEGGFGEQDLGEGETEKYNARASWSNDRFGIVLFGSHNGRDQVTDNREYEIEQDPAGGIRVNNLDFRSYFVDREDQAYGGTVEFRPQEDVRLFASMLFSEFTDFEQRNQYELDFADGDNPGFGLVGTPLTPDVGYQPLVIVTRLLEDGVYRNFTRPITLGADFPFAGEWDVKARLNYTETGNSSILPIPFSAGGQVAASYDVRDIEDPIVEIFEPLSFDPAAAVPLDINTIDYAQTLGLVFRNELNTEAWKLRIDAERDVDFLPTDARLKIGVQYDTREAEGGDVLAFGGYPAEADPAQFLTPTPWFSDFDSTLGGRYYRNVEIADAWQANGGDFAPPFEADSLVAIDEDLYAAYAMLTQDMPWGNIVYGARVEYTDYTSEGPSIAVAFDSSYFDILPSVHVNVDLAEDVKLRLSGSSGLSRPTYNELRASAVVDPTNRSVSGGNPLLNAETAWGGDASLEWYYGPAGLLSAAVFYRAVDNVLYTDTTTVDGGLYVPTDAGVPYILSGVVNGDEGELTGFELNFIGQATDLLPSPFDGFGVTGNITLLDSEFDTQAGTSFSLPGTSDVIYNASLYYEKYGISARINYQYRDEWLSTTENDALAEFWDEQERVDFSLRYVLPAEWTSVAQVTLFLNANNLTDFVDVRYNGTPATPNQVEAYGRRYLVGARVDF